jgi:hypothetical protein
VKFHVYYTRAETFGRLVSEHRWTLDRSFDTLKEALSFLANAQDDIALDSVSELQIVKDPE